jgi:hypothetical protein
MAQSELSRNSERRVVEVNEPSPQADVRGYLRSCSSLEPGARRSKSSSVGRTGLNSQIGQEIQTVIL